MTSNEMRSLIDLVMALYSETRSRPRMAMVASDSFEIWVGVHQGLPLLFILVMEEAAKVCIILACETCCMQLITS